MREQMRFIPTIVHGLADYVVGLVVIALPLYFEWAESPRVAFVALGLLVIVYSLLTDYELGFFRLLRIRFHLLLDALFGIGMLLAPTLLSLPPSGRALIYVIGGLSIFLSCTTNIRAQGTQARAAA
jgi:hypothetical protein